MDKETAKKKIAEMSEEEKNFFKECLGISKDEKDIDLVDGFLKLEKRLTDIEKLIKDSPKKKGFLEGLFE